ncbi:MAG: hypothetical protein KKG47_09570 [Proteobacteria bacterium]|nr:hypothetical protein [Pseudomonadota bacterium]MBU1736866.1 hypothetical protein [Pseudomonadota bacterium]
MFRKTLYLLVLLMASGCAMEKTYFVYERPEADICLGEGNREMVLVDSAGDSYSVYRSRTSLFIAGTEEGRTQLLEDGVFASSRKLDKAGPLGETVFIEADENDPSLFSRLENTFNESPKLLKHWSDSYFFWKYHERFFVIGNFYTNRMFASLKHLPYTKTLFDAGPNGETVVFEVNVKDPDFVTRLVEEHQLRNPELIISSCADYFVWRYRNRLYVLGSVKSSNSFETMNFLRHSKAYLGAGPNGETVVFEDDKSNPALLERLTGRFFKEICEDRSE